MIEPERSVLLDGAGDLSRDPLAIVGMERRLPRVERAGERGRAHAEQL